MAMPSYKPAQGTEQEKKKGPLASGLGKPLFQGIKVRGENSAFIGRLRSLSKKDLVFILAGLSVLAMAPIAELFMAAPEQGDALQSGFDRKGPLFPDGASLYENGTGGLSPGDLIGQAGTDVITPLNVRDPSALIMGSGAMRMPSATRVSPRASPASSRLADSDWKNAITQAASRGAQAAVKKAKLPAPNAKLPGALRGLAALSGTGSGGSAFRLEPLFSSAVPKRVKASNALSRVQAAPGFRGIAARSPMAGGTEAMKDAGNRQAEIMNKGSSSSNSLDVAARTPIPAGGLYTGAGGASEGSETKNSGGSTIKDSKGVTLEESLALLKARLELEKDVDLTWKKKTWKEFERQKMVEELLIKSAIEGIIGKGLFDPIGKSIADAFGALAGGPKGVSCLINGSIVHYTMEDWNRYGRQAAQNGGFIHTCRPWPGSIGDVGQENTASGNGSEAPLSQAPSRLPSPSGPDLGEETAPLGSIPAARDSRQALGGLEDHFFKTEAAVQKAERQSAHVEAQKWDKKPQWQALIGKIKEGQESLKETKEELANAQNSVETANAGADAALSHDSQALDLAGQMMEGSARALAQMAAGMKNNPIRHGLNESRFQEEVRSKASAADVSGGQHRQAALKSMSEAEQGLQSALQASGRALETLKSTANILAESRKQYQRLSQLSAAEAEPAISAINEAIAALNEEVAAMGPARDRVATSAEAAGEMMKNAREAQQETSRAVQEAGTSGAPYQAAQLAWEGAKQRGARDLEGKRVVLSAADPATEALAAEVKTARDWVSQAEQRLGIADQAAAEPSAGGLSALVDGAAEKISAARQTLNRGRETLARNNPI